MAGETPATRALAAAGIAFSTHRYEYDPGADSIGLAAAEALGEHPSRVLKTLMVRIDGKPACAILAADLSLSMKRLAAAAGGKSAGMMPPPEAERLTGYKVGGISPIGQKKPVRTFLDAAAAREPFVYVNGGQRGLQLRLDPADLAAAAAAVIAPLGA
ncbi:Cys-tRNA(Pro) deacylase [Sphingomonas profundi]|uniref:Cys-tRNA(Pro) deacylase n=1 Tax=Alterirhizorhabdus profundi TaxID=2681549 RepID=UPI0012E91BEB|nr:Cys-tRNA(Pro) deacylase [Sphingomonas profundi]